MPNIKSQVLKIESDQGVDVDYWKISWQAEQVILEHIVASLLLVTERDCLVRDIELA